MEHTRGKEGSRYFVLKKNRYGNRSDVDPGVRRRQSNAASAVNGTKSPKDRFACIYKTTDNDEVVIPRDFTKKWWQYLQSPLQLTSSSNVNATVEIWNDNGDLVLGRGWKEFAEKHTGIAIIDCVLFEYMGRNNFEVTFFGFNRMEQKTIPVSDYCFPVSSYVPLINRSAHITSKMSWGFKQLFQPHLENPLYIHCENGLSYEIWINESDNNLWLEDGWAYMLEDNNITQESYIFLTYLGKSDFVLKSTKGMGNRMEYTRRHPNPTDVGEALSYTDICVATTFGRTVRLTEPPLHVPPEFAPKLFTVRQESVDVLLPREDVVQTWKLTWSITGGSHETPPPHCWIVDGWQKLAVEKDAIAGDVIRFFKRAGEDFFRVHLIKKES